MIGDSCAWYVDLGTDHMHCYKNIDHEWFIGISFAQTKQAAIRRAIKKLNKIVSKLERELEK
jgi:hypothetical protein